jgi:flagellum-specific peptidoglycan hydrolase FlgJ
MTTTMAKKTTAPKPALKVTKEPLKGAFPADIVAAAIAAGAKYDAPPSVVLAQAALETGFFKHFPPDSHNYLGIKAVGDQPHVTVPTREFYHGHWVTVNANFRKFANAQECFMTWGRWITLTPIYAAAGATWKRTRDAFKTADAIAHHWATDPNYASKVRDIMADYKLTDLDAKILHGEPANLANAPSLPAIDPDAPGVVGISKA